MALKTEPQFHVRGSVQQDIIPGGLDEQAAVNGRGDLSIVLGLPERSELARLGQSWIGMSAGQTPVNAVPTVTAGVSLFNGEPQQNGKSYLIDSIFMFNLVTQALVTNFTLMCNLNIGTVTAPSGGTVIAPWGTSGKNYGGNAAIKSGTTVVANQWVPHGSSYAQPNTANINMTLDIPVYGLYIVRPGGCFSIAGLVANAPVATSVQLGIRWHEASLPLG